MNIASTVMMLALVGQVQGPAQSGEVRVAVRMLDMNGVEWRSSVHPKMTPAGRQGMTCSWTAGKDVAGEIARKADKVVAAPCVVSLPGASVHIESKNRKNYVADMKRVADGPYNQAKAIAYLPQVEPIDEGFDVDLVASPGREGMRVKMSLNDTRVVAIHTCAIPETTLGDPEKGAKPTTIAAQIQVPEFVSGKAEGEWVVPNDGVVVLSLGVTSKVDAKGKTVTCERLALIEASTMDEPIQADVRKTAFMSTRRTASVAGPAWKAVPPPPSPGSVPAPAAVAPPEPIGLSALMPIASPTVPPMGVAMCPQNQQVEAEGKDKDEKPAKRTARFFASLGRPTTSVEGRVFSVSPLPFLNVGLSITSNEAKTPADAEAPALPVLAPPARALPKAVTRDGTIVELPPLPEEDDCPEVASGEPLAAPQARPVAPPSPRSADSIHAEFASRVRESMNECVLYPVPHPAVIASVPALERRGAALARRVAEECPADEACKSAPLASLTDADILRAAFETIARRRGIAASFDGCPMPVGYDVDFALADGKPEDEAADPIGAIGIEVMGPKGAPTYQGSTPISNLGDEPMTIRVPTANGGMVEITARLVKKPTAKAGK